MSLGRQRFDRQPVEPVTQKWSDILWFETILQAKFCSNWSFFTLEAELFDQTLAVSNEWSEGGSVVKTIL